MKKTLLFAFLAAAVMACSSSSSDPNLDAWTQEVRAISVAQIGDRQFEEIAHLEEHEPIRDGSYESSAISSAKYRLRRRAAELDADAVVIVACDRDVEPIIHEDATPRTGPKIVCQGVAIRWTDY